MANASVFMTKLPGPVRLVLADLMGYDDAEPPLVPAGLAAPVGDAVAAGIAALIAYQGPGYAQLYVRRVSRFIGRRGVDDSLLAEIARLLAGRMSFHDIPRIAELKLAGAGRDIADRIRFRLDEILASLPAMLAEPLLELAGWLKWSRLPVRLRFSPRPWPRRMVLRLWALLARWRPSAVRAGQERALVERWLHMIDRALTLRPAAAAAVVATATLIHGEGESYRRRVANWHVVIDTLAKPVFDGVLDLPDLAGALVEAQALALADPDPEALRRDVLRLTAAAGQKFAS